MHRFAIGIAILFLALLTAFLTWGHDYLCIEDERPAERADLVVALAGPPAEDRQRVQAGADLVKAGHASVMLLPVRHRALDWPWFVSHYQIRDPFPEGQVIVGHPDDGPPDSSPELGGTFAEAVKTIEIMQRHHFRSAIVVSSCYHMRRARLAFERANDGASGLQFFFQPVDTQGADGMPWFLKGGYAMRVADEYIKLVGGYLFYR
jgi:hypothetical protein